MTCPHSDHSLCSHGVEEALWDREEKVREAVSGRQYDPYDRSVFGGLGRKMDANHFDAMREYYTRGKKLFPPPSIKVGDITPEKKAPIALPAAPAMKMITERASC